MRMGYGFGKRYERESQRRERARFLGSAFGLWAMCAAGIYLMGPSEPEAGPHELVAGAAASDPIDATFAGQRP